MHMLSALTATSKAFRPALRTAVGTTRRAMSTTLPMEPPIRLFGTAGRYANALYTAAAKKGALLDVEADLKLFMQTVAVNDTLRNFVLDPSIARTAKANGITSILEAAKAEEVTKNTFVVMAEGGRLGDVFKVIELYSELLASAKGEMSAVIKSATPLDAADISEIEDFLKLQLDGDVTKLSTTVEVDPALISGITIECGDSFIDLSVATELKKLHTLLSDGL